MREAAVRVPDLTIRALATRYEAARDEALQANGSAWQAVTHPEDLLADADRKEDLQDSSQARERHLRPDGVLTKPLDGRRVRALVDEPSRVRT